MSDEHPPESLTDLPRALKYGISERDTLVIELTIIFSILIAGVYIKKGIEFAVPAALGIGIVGVSLSAITLGVWNLVTSPPSIPPEAGVAALALIVALPILGVIGYYAEKHDWMEEVDNEPF